MKRNHKNPFVTLWDALSNTFVQIPKSELAPGMVQCKIEGRKGFVWREAASIDFSKTPYRHPHFHGAIRSMIEFLAGLFPGIYELSYEQWEEGFRKDTNPLQEIRIWLVIATVFREFEVGRPLSYRKELFRHLMVCTVTAREYLPFVIERELLSTDEVDAIANSYYRHLAR